MDVEKQKNDSQEGSASSSKSGEEGNGGVRKESSERERCRRSSGGSEGRHRSERKGSGKESRSETESRSRDRERSSRPHHREKDKERKSERKEKRRQRSSSQSRSPEGDSSTSRKRRGRDRRRRSSSRYSSEDDSDHARSYTHRNDSYSYEYQEPNETIMVRGLALHLTELDIRQDILLCGIMAKDVRLIRNRDTGDSRGFAFVEFHSVMDAKNWMEIKKGVLVLHEQFHANLIYSIPKLNGTESHTRVDADWDCKRCNAHNFKRREFCFKCHAARPPPTFEKYDCLRDEVSTYPTSVIILCNLDALTVEDTVLEALKCRPNIARIPIKSVKIAREAGSTISRGVCYVEANNTSDAASLMSFFEMETVIIDGRYVSAVYGKQSNLASAVKKCNAAATALAAAQWKNTDSSTSGGPPCAEVKTEADVEKMAHYYTSLYANSPEDFSSYLDYYRNYYRQEMRKKYVDVPSSTFSSTSANQQQQQPTSSYSRKNSVGSHFLNSPQNQDSNIQQTNTIWYNSYYDEASGYYYDAGSGMYYDSSTQSYYDPGTQQYLRWSPETNQYVSISESCRDVGKEGTVSESAHVPDGSTVEKRKEKKKGKHEKVSEATKITKQMEKWAKTLQPKKQSVKQVPAASSCATASSSSSSAFLAATTEKSSTSTVPGKFQREYDYSFGEDLPTFQPAAKMTGMDSFLPLFESEPDYDYGHGGSDDDTFEFSSSARASTEPSAIDEKKLVCLLCKRKFSSKDMLEKHVKMSDLHKQNLDSRTQSTLSAST